MTKKKRSGFSGRLGSLLYFQLPIPIGDKTIEIAIITFIGVVLWLLLSVAMGVYALINPPASYCLPLPFHIVMFAIVLSGVLSGREASLRLRSYIGLDPRVLYVNGADGGYKPKSKKRRMVLFLALSFVLASLIGWLIYIKPLGYFDLEIDAREGYVWAILAFIRVWVRFVIPNFFSNWRNIMLIAIFVLIIIDNVPIGRWMTRKSNVIEMITPIIFASWMVWLVVWWYQIYDPVY